MAWLYWERWYWELLWRKEALQWSRGSIRISVEPHVLEIDEALLLNPAIEHPEPEVYVGQGSQFRCYYPKMKHQPLWSCRTSATSALQHWSIAPDVDKMLKKAPFNHNGHRVYNFAFVCMQPQRFFLPFLQDRYTVIGCDNNTDETNAHAVSVLLMSVILRSLLLLSYVSSRRRR